MRATAALTLTSTLLWISGALSACHPRIPSLHVELRGPTSVQDVDDLYVVTAITNTGGEAVKLARNQGTLMGKMRSDIFDITRSCGSRVSYTTYKTRSDVASAANNFIVLDPGHALMVMHELPESYDFTSTGVGMYEVRLKPDLIYHYLDPRTGALALMTASLSPESTHSVHVLGDLTRRPGFRNTTILFQPEITLGAYCRDRQAWADIIMEDVPEAWRLARAAMDALEADPRGESAAFKRWFGDTKDNTEARNIVYSHFQSILEHAGTHTTGLNCAIPGNDPKAVCKYYEENPRVIASSFPDELNQITLCKNFFMLPAFLSDKPSRIRTILHEYTHFAENGGTNNNADHTGLVAETYIPAACKKLTPDAARNNAENYALYSGEVWTQPPPHPLPPWQPPGGSIDVTQVVLG